LAAAEAICGADAPEGIESLLDKNMLKREEEAGGESRFTMLEMLRDYSLERLQASGEEEGIRGLHAEYYLALALAADVKLRGAEQLVWLDRLEQEHDNLLAVLHWSIGEVEGVSFEDMGNVEG